jgi:hypothetical protein
VQGKLCLEIDKETQGEEGLKREEKFYSSLESSSQLLGFLHREDQP